VVILFIILRLSFITTDPIGSDDYFRYLWDGKVQASSINPYLFAPNAPELAHLRTDQLPALINQPHLQTMYFPLSEWIFYLTYLISGVNIIAYKILLFLSRK
jgi:alpha-1,6-mannosyltransferase